MNATVLPPNERQERDAFSHVRKLGRFYRHLLIYLVVNLGLLAVNLTYSQQTLWVVWVIFGWGLGVLMHALKVFKSNLILGPEWEKREVEKRLGRPL